MIRLLPTVADLQHFVAAYFLIGLVAAVLCGVSVAITAVLNRFERAALEKEDARRELLDRVMGLRP